MMLVVLVGQMILGEVQYRNALPWGLVLVHVFLAATIWTLAVALTYLLWRPPSPSPPRRARAAARGARRWDSGPRVRFRDGRPSRAPHRRDARLRRPVLIAAFKGWNDGGQAATLAASTLVRAWSAERFADIDPEGFVDFQATRPTVSLVQGMTRRIDWPENVFHAGAISGAERDAVILLGVEPNYRWRAFNEIVARLARELRVELVVTLGALLADVPHTRPAPVTGSASDASLVEELGLQPSRYEGPTGIVGVLHDACRRRGSRRSACGRRCRTTSPSPPARARRARCAPASGSCSASRSHSASWRMRRRSTRSRSARQSHRIPRRRSTSRSWSGGRTRSRT